MNQYLKYLRKTLENSRGKRPQDECERILGQNGKVWDFAAFYEKNEEDILVFVSAALMKYLNDKSFTKEEMEIYKLGLTELPVFMAKCMNERDRNQAEQVEKIKQKVESSHQPQG